MLKKKTKNKKKNDCKFVKYVINIYAQKYTAVWVRDKDPEVC